ncbi:MAG: hypothetical protein DCC68_02990 [Planctomycetota bacterium]|nr:MAG: hypothetical protein DCC68_02990 [Planctomycetota bacterium]
MSTWRRVFDWRVVVILLAGMAAVAPSKEPPRKLSDDATPAGTLRFDVQSVASGAWSSEKTWSPRPPRAGDRVKISAGTRVVYDVASDDVIRMIQVVGTLSFARDRDTLLNVGIVKVQASETCSESGFACDFAHATDAGEPTLAPTGPMPAFEVGTLNEPIPAEHTARIRLHYLDGMDKDDAPALACCSARMDLHGAPMNRTWVDLGADAGKGDKLVVLAEDVTGWRAGDDIIVTASLHNNSLGGQYRDDPSMRSTEQRRIKAIDGRKLTLDNPLEHRHFGSGDFRSEVANLSRNVIIESADPNGVRGHTVYHCFSQGGISYARFAHLGKENVLGRYAIHFHLLEDSNRGSQVLGAAIVDSENRWVTIHGTDYMVVRDCVGYGSVGHGFFLEDGTETYTVLDRNLGVNAFRGKPLPKQVLSFDPNDGAAFWWANGRNTFVRNTSCENDEYGFRYDSQKRSNFDSNLSVRTPTGSFETTDIRTIPIYRFEGNEAHSEGLYGMVIAGTDRVAPDLKHPHVLKNLRIWQVHYALRPQVPAMWIENVTIDHTVYGVYRPEFENHEYRNLRIASTSSEPFNRGQDDDSTQHGTIAVDGLTFTNVEGDGIPLIQMSDNNPSGTAESHFRNVRVERREGRRQKALVDRGGGAEVDPQTPTSVPVFLHDYFGPGKHAKIVSTAAGDFPKDSQEFRREPPLTGEESRVAEVKDVAFPKLLDPVDDAPPATIITYPPRGVSAKRDGNRLLVRGTTTDNVRTKRVVVNGVAARDVDYNFHQWEAVLENVSPGEVTIEAHAEDAAGNVERNAHRLVIAVE